MKEMSRRKITGRWQLGPGGSLLRLGWALVVLLFLGRILLADRGGGFKGVRVLWDEYGLSMTNDFWDYGMDVYGFSM
jgi:hypothetical protein